MLVLLSNAFGTNVAGDIFNAIGTHWIPNLIFFVIFMVFAASFLGAFEITLPSSLVNKSDAGADKGGLIGIFFMALTLVLVSFSCTGPIVVRGEALLFAALDRIQHRKHDADRNDDTVPGDLEIARLKQKFVVGFL